MRIVLTLLIIWNTSGAHGALPTELDPFLEKLFDHEECEEFISSGDYTNIATSKCSPLTCDFPRQLCARPAAKFQDSSANICRNIPTECLTAANGGVPVAPAPFRLTTQSPFPMMPNFFNTPAPSPNLIVTMPPPTNPLAICQMPAPTGRFCGFRPMYTYNRETLQCDEFWFPGCPTAETNANLFQDYHSCQKIADLCKPTPSPTLAPFQPQTVRPKPPPTPAPPKNKPPPSQPSPIVDTLKSFGVGGGSNGAMGQGALGAIGMFTGSGLGATGQGPLGSFGPSGNSPSGGGGAGGAGGAGAAGGNGEDLGLFGLIQQGLMGAQAAQGGKGGKEAASKAAGKILEQFTGFDLGGLGNNFGGLFGR